MANRNNYALQINDEALTAELMNDLAAQDLSPVTPLDTNIQDLRDKIKSARLEKLMASQLETEFDIPMGSDTPVMESTPADTYFDDQKAEEQAEFMELPDAANSQESKYGRREELFSDETSFETTQNVNLSHSIRSSEMLCREIAESMELYSKLNQRAETLRENLGEFESDLVSLDKMRGEYEQLNDEYQKLSSRLNDRENTLACQSKHITHLESRLNSTNGVLESTKEELKRAKETNALQDKGFRNLRMKHASAQDENRLLENKIGQLEATMEEKSRKLEASRQKAIDDIDTIESLRDEVSSLNSEKRQLKMRLDEVQNKHDEFNRRGLEQQSNHHSKVHELEKTIRQLQRDVDTARQDKAQAVMELKAANNLVAIHEEMLEKLSTEQA